MNCVDGRLANSARAAVFALRDISGMESFQDWCKTIWLGVLDISMEVGREPRG